MTEPVVPQFSYLYRMGAGFAGEVNRAHPFTIEPAYNDSATPVLLFGLACLINTTASGGAGNKTGVRGVQAGDTAVTYFWGVVSRPFPTQAATEDGNFGQANSPGGAPPSGGVIGVLRSGYIVVQVNGTPGKGDPAYIWCGATATVHVQGGWEASAGTTALTANAYFNGAPDSAGLTELEFNV
jgi:hypothetical protein